MDDRSESIIYPNVQIGPGAQIGAWVIIGEPPRGRAPGELPTVIGAGAIIRSHTVIYAGNRIGNHLQTGHRVTIREENDIGDEVSIGTGTVVEHHIVIEDGVRIQSQTVVGEYSQLERGCWIGPHVVLTNVLHPLCPQAKQCLRGPRIGAGAKIGGNTTILPDRQIGENALVGAGSVVAKDVPARSVVAGNPAVVIKRIEDLTCPYGLREAPYEADEPED